MEKSRMSMDRLMRAAIEQGASDIHLVVGVPPTLRVKGALQPLATVALSADDTTNLMTEVVHGDDRTKFDAEGAVDFALAKDGTVFRANVARELKGPALALRLIPGSIKTPQELGLSEHVVKLFDRPQGLILVTGATGSGKSTTMASLLQWCADNRALRIVTVEQPVEYRISHGKSVVTQFEVPNHVHTFSRALANMLRQDPDVIMVGELRDLATMEMAMHAAETGHLVVATLHTNSAMDSIDRILTVFPPEREQEIRTVLASCLLAVISQCLLPRQDGSGRVMAYELLIRTTGLAGMIRKGQTAGIDTVIQTGGKLGMQQLDSHLLALVRDGVISPEAALSKARQRATLEQSIRKLGGK